MWRARIRCGCGAVMRERRRAPTSSAPPTPTRLNSRSTGNGLCGLKYATNLYGYHPNIVGGHLFNIVSNGFAGAVIGGGGYELGPNRVGADWATIVGGLGNTASGDYSTVGGYASEARGNYSAAFGAFADASGVASIAMGYGSEASGGFSTALGRNAKARHEGSFVWGDSQTGNFTSTTANQFSLRAFGGVRLSDDTPNLAFGSTTRQMINLLDAEYGIGVQTGTMYFRSDSRFSWFRDGSH